MWKEDKQKEECEYGPHDWMQVIDRRGSVFYGVWEEKIQMTDRRGRCQQKKFELFAWTYPYICAAQ